MRHAYATAALRAGVPAQVVASRLGHTDVRTTMCTYAHVHTGDDTHAAQAVADAMLGSV